MTSNKTPVPQAESKVTAPPKTQTFDLSNTRQGIHAKVIRERDTSTRSGSSQVGSTAIYHNYDRVVPPVDFRKRAEFYLSVGRVQNVVESYKLNIINREWYYDDTGNGANQQALEVLEEWEENTNLTKMLGEKILNWIVFGEDVRSPKDWIALQMQSIVGKRIDDNGDTTEYIQVIDGIEHVLDAKEFIIDKYIDFDRAPWGVGMFDSLMNRDWLDTDGRDPISSLELYRQVLQDYGKIMHKYGSPRVIYTIPGANEETIDNDITPMVEGMGPGDRAVLNQELLIQQETVDGAARFTEQMEKIIDEVDSGLQSSANRLIAEPSAMADAREAGNNDDDRTLGFMEKIRIFMNKEVIPRVTGLDRGVIEFKWGSKDTFGLQFPEAIEKALDKKVITLEQARVILMDEFHWKFPSNDEVKDLEIVEPIQETEPAEIPQDNTVDKQEKLLDKKLKLEMIEMVGSLKELENGR
jgi:hypothetical protein